MVTVKYIPALLAAAMLAILPSDSGAARLGSDAQKTGDSLFTQSAAESLTRDFTDPNVSFLLLDARSGSVLASRWDHPDAPIPMGSLVKPFTALAYGEQHG